MGVSHHQRNTVMAASVVRPTRSKPKAESTQPTSKDPSPNAAEKVSGQEQRTVSGFNGNRRVPQPVNEVVKSYAPGSAERTELKARLQSMSNERVDIPLIIGGAEVRTGQLAQAVMPHNHRHVLADWHRAEAEHV